MSIEVIILAVLILVLTVVMLVQANQLRAANARLAQISGQAHPIKINEPTAAELEAKLKAAYEAQIAASSQVFAEDLKATSARLGEQVSRLTTTVIEEELTAYQQTLEEVRKSAAEGMEKIRAAVEEQRIELRKNMEADLAAERARQVELFNAKLGDVVSSYIAESLGGGVDLGAQMQYILASLESHKEDISKDLLNGV